MIRGESGAASGLTKGGFWKEVVQREVGVSEFWVVGCYGIDFE